MSLLLPPRLEPSCGRKGDFGGASSGAEAEAPSCPLRIVLEGEGEGEARALPMPAVVAVAPGSSPRRCLLSRRRKSSASAGLMRPWGPPSSVFFAFAMKALS